MSVVALCGGIGGAKLALGLARVLPPGELTVIVNTGDDFEHLGLSISPDIDTVLYTLSGLADRERGWGRRDESWNFMEALGALGEETWFSLGDRDLALHVLRTRMRAGGQTLSEITDALRLRLGIGARIVPMADAPVRTRLRTSLGWLDFQDYFVRQRCMPVVQEIRYAGADRALPSAAALKALADPALQAVVICPSNPMLSIEPMLALALLHRAVKDCAAPVIAVSPLIGGAAVKGPTAKLMHELGMEVTAASVAARYEGIIDAFVIDPADAGQPMPADVATLSMPVLMTSIEDREALAKAVLALAQRLRGGVSR